MMAAVAGKALDSVRCHLCSTFSSKRLTAFERHLVDVHGTTAQLAWDAIHDGPVLCACGCGNPTTWIGWKRGYSRLIIGHNGNLEAVYGKEKAQEISERRRQKLVGQKGWSKGLTKDTDERIASRAQATATGRKRAFEAGKIVPWSRGLTKDNDERLHNLSLKQKERFASGELVPWAKGLTQDNDARIKKMATKVSLSHTQAGIRQKLDQIKRLKFDEIKLRIEGSGRLKVVGTELPDYTNDNTPNILAECSTCGTRTLGTLRKLQHGRCHVCDPGGSRTQHEVANWIRTLGVTVDTNRRDLINGLEVDVFVPSHQLAIEYNGLYWHSLLHKSTTYHQNKTDRCNDAGIKLFHLFEDEWRDRRAIVESMIKHRLNMSPDRIGARTCSLVTLDTKQRREFFNANHIDGDVSCQCAFGLKRDDEIVAAISLRKPFHRSHQGSLEVARYCNKLETSVPGGLGRLTKAAREFAKAMGYVTLLTYVDTRLGTREGWDAAGWRQTTATPPRFWWTDFTDRFNRFQFKADRTNGLSEAQVAEAANVVKIYGCKNLTLMIDV